MRRIALFFALLSGCAGLDIKRAKGPDDEGLHFYRPAAYVMISSTGSGCSLDVKYLPDTAADYVLIPHAGAGSFEFNPTLDNGWNLTALSAKVDSGASALTTALGTILSTVLGAAVPKAAASLAAPTGEAKAASDGLHPGLYKLDATHLESCGGTPQSKCLIPIAVNQNQVCATLTDATH